MKRLLIRLAIFLLPSYAISARAATQIYIPSTSTYQGSSSVINIASGTIRNINASTFTVTNFVVTNSTATNLKVSSLTVTNASIQNAQLGAVTSTAPWTLSGFVTSSTEIVTLGTATVMNISSAVVTNSIAIGEYGIAGKPDSPLSIYNDGSKFSSRPGIDIDVKNSASTRIPALVVTNRTAPSLSVGSCLAFYQQTAAGNDIQQGLIAYSQQSSTNASKVEYYVQSGSITSGTSIPVVATYGVNASSGVNSSGYAFTMFGPTGAEYSTLTPYGAYTPGSMIHVASDFADDEDGIRIERRRTPNAARYNLRVLADGGLGFNPTSNNTMFEMTSTSITISTPTMMIGRNDGSTPPAGYVGEQFKETDGNDRGIISGQFVSHSTQSVTAGIYMCSGYIEVNGNGVAWTAAQAALSLFPNNTTTDHVTGYNVVNYAPSSPGINDIVGLTIPQFLVNVNTTSNVYIKYKVTSAGAVKFRDSGITCTRL